MANLRWRFLVVAGTILFGTYLLFPSLYYFQTGKRITKVQKADDPWWYSVFPAETLKLGLDLKGGLHLALGINFDEVYRDSVARLKANAAETLATEKIEGVTLTMTADNRIEVRAPNTASREAADKAISKTYGQWLDFDKRDGDAIFFHISPTYQAEVRERAIDQSLETLRNRIDEFGVAEPILQRKGDDKIIVQFPGVQEPGRLKEIIARTAKLSFQIVRSGPENAGGPPAAQELQGWVDEFVKSKSLKLDSANPITKHTSDLNKFIEAKAPKGTELLFHRIVDVNTKEASYIPYLLDRDALVTGEDLDDAFVSFNQDSNEPIVSFRLNPNGATKFEKATGANINKFMAIVLDNNVHSAPRIKSRIGGGSAMIEMSSRDRGQAEVYADAKDTALVLRSGALPARLEFLEERVIGPSLGADAIRQGKVAFIAGSAIVFLFLMFYYRASGIIACGALLMNFLFTLAGMSAFEGTLTLPGLAGMVLGLGMSVDSNVLIFEHVRDELRRGVPLRTAIGEAYSKSSSAIWDANITALISGLILLNFGYGPIRGFAVTLLLGIVASVYTATFVTRVVFDYLVTVRQVQKVSI